MNFISIPCKRFSTTTTLSLFLSRFKWTGTHLAETHRSLKCLVYIVWTDPCAIPNIKVTPHMNNVYFISIQKFLYFFNMKLVWSLGGRPLRRSSEMSNFPYPHINCIMTLQIHQKLLINFHWFPFLLSLSKTHLFMFARCSTWHHSNDARGTSKWRHIVMTS